MTEFWKVVRIFATTIVIMVINSASAAELNNKPWPALNSVTGNKKNNRDL